ncbi:helix-turn-helix domain-containing protein [Neptuniibacter marinus]|uniref:helix-turn-helix domain-containing protein n=1 Tax=Neptuniibacter marinus TaxID=1806670 RepID=UPI003B5A6498
MTLFRTNWVRSLSSKRYTQAELVLAILQIKGPTTTDQFRSLGVKSPSAVIYRLRKLGYRIGSRYVERRSLEDPNRVKQAEYKLSYTGTASNSLPFFYQR